MGNSVSNIIQIGPKIEALNYEAAVKEYEKMNRLQNLKTIGVILAFLVLAAFVVAAPILFLSGL